MQQKECDFKLEEWLIRSDLLSDQICINSIFPVCTARGYLLHSHKLCLMYIAYIEWHSDNIYCLHNLDPAVQ